MIMSHVRLVVKHFSTCYSCELPHQLQDQIPACTPIHVLAWLHLTLIQLTSPVVPSLPPVTDLVHKWSLHCISHITILLLRILSTTTPLLCFQMCIYPSQIATPQTVLFLLVWFHLVAQVSILPVSSLTQRKFLIVIALVPPVSYPHHLKFFPKPNQDIVLTTHLHGMSGLSCICLILHDPQCEYHI